jgi:ribosomal protein S12
VCARAAHQERKESHCVRPCKWFRLYLNLYANISDDQNDGCLNFVDENDEVLISGFGRRGKAKGDIPGVRFKVVKVSGVGLLALWSEKKVRHPAYHYPLSLLTFMHSFTGEAPVIINSLSPLIILATPSLLTASRLLKAVMLVFTPTYAGFYAADPSAFRMQSNLLKHPCCKPPKKLML